MELYHPVVLVSLGEWNQLSQGIRIIVSSNQTGTDWAKVSLTPELQEKITVHAGEKAVIRLGYEETLYTIFEGFIVSATSDGILMKDPMVMLQSTIMINTYLDALPQEIIVSCLTAAGITRYQLSEQAYSAKTLVVRKKKASEVLEQINQEWDIQNRWQFKNGTFYWGIQFRQETVYEFEYGVNIISLTRSGSGWELVTAAVPFIQHSQIIKISHPKVNGEFEVTRISIRTDAAGFIHTTIYFEVAYGT